MNSAEICPLTEEAVADLLASRDTRRHGRTGDRRKSPRWPFPGTAELWVPDECGREFYTLATSLNLSIHGVGLRCDDPLPEGLEMGIALHEPEMSLHGRVRVRHCTEVEGEFLLGVEFIRDEA